VRHEENDAAGIVLVQGLAKGGRDEMAVEAATGLGVERIIPWAAARSVAVWSGERAERGRRRWEAIARAETTVARRAWVPRVDGIMTTAGLAEAIWTGDLAGAQVLVLHESATVGLGQAIRQAEAAPPRMTVLVVGPEGGVAPEELSTLSDAGAAPVRLGKAILRSSSAGPAALAALKTLHHQWD
jgi:16S rRNA (uracil1498-N3)-methyltransferase